MDAHVQSGGSSGTAENDDNVDLAKRLLDSDAQAEGTTGAAGGDNDIDVLAPDNLIEDPNQASSRSTSASPPPELSPTRIRNQLAGCLSHVRYAGSFTSSRVSQLNVDPGLYINDIGSISLPLTLENAKAIMKAAHQAPFGRGSETIIDKSFRNTRELNVDCFQLRNPAWTQYLQDIVTPLGIALGFTDSPAGIETVLYKLLLYEEGAMFKPHKDSEKTNGMFGTLVVCLPSKHEGGGLVLEHRGEKVVFETAESSEFGQSHIAWYSDVVHEIKPVKSGYRLVLTYNLVHTQHDGPASANMITEEKSVVLDILNEWKRRLDARQPTLNKLAYVLEHKYSEANLRLNSLKGHDRVLSRYLKQNCCETGFVILLANMTLTIFNAEDTQTEEDDRNKDLNLSHIVDANGQLILSGAKFDDQEIIQRDCFDRWPDEVESEETGNEGVAETHFYRDAVIILMTSAFYLEFRLLELSFESIVGWIQEHINILKKGPHQPTKDHLIMICKWEAQNFHIRRGIFGAENIIAEVVRACEVLEDSELLLGVVKGCAPYSPGRRIHHALADTLHAFDFAAVQASLDELTSYDEHLNVQMDIIQDIRSRHKPKKDDSTFILPNLIAWEKSQTIKALQQTTELIYEDTSRLIDIVKHQGEDFTFNRVLPFLDKHRSESVVLVPFVALLSEARRTGDIPPTTVTAVLDTLVLTTVMSLSLVAFRPKQAEKEPYWYSKSDYGTRENWKQFADHTACFIVYVYGNGGKMRHVPFWYGFGMRLMRLTCVGMEPAKPSTLARKPRGCGDESCEDCAKLNEFLKDPITASALFDDSKSNYGYGGGHVYSHATAHECKLDRKEKTVRVTKTNKDWEDEHREWLARYRGVREELSCLRSSQELLGEKYEEFVSLQGLRTLR